MEHELDELAAALEDLVHEYIALAIATNQPANYRLNPALVAAAAVIAKRHGQE